MLTTLFVYNEKHNFFKWNMLFKQIKQKRQNKLRINAKTKKTDRRTDTVPCIEGYQKSIVVVITFFLFEIKKLYFYWELFTIVCYARSCCKSFSSVQSIISF